ncbi:MAG TPA: hypothetical protein PKV86_10565 [Syntrophobacteraceae bacterium]|nr:hypothetical protein [Syntrophobacteraceae bacterium]
MKDRWIWMAVLLSLVAVVGLSAGSARAEQGIEAINGSWRITIEWDSGGTSVSTVVISMADRHHGTFQGFSDHGTVEKQKKKVTFNFENCGCEDWVLKGRKRRKMMSGTGSGTLSDHQVHPCTWTAENLDHQDDSQEML